MSPSDRDGPAGNRPWLVELAGPAGAGKSTLARHLQSDPRVLGTLSLWGLPPTLLLRRALGLTPTVLSSAIRRQLRFGELAQMARLDALLQVVDRAMLGGHRLIVMDEGPVFGLTWLGVFFESNGDTRRTQWRRRALERWAAKLDAVIWLDAPDRTLAERIRFRAKPHPVKDRSDDDIDAFTARFRVVFDQVITDIAAHGHTTVLHLRTDHRAVDQAAASLFAALEGIRVGR